MKRLSFVLSAFVIALSTIMLPAFGSVTDDEKRDVRNFNGVSASGSFDVEVTMGNTEGLRLEGSRSDLENVETRVVNGILTIRNKPGNFFRFQGKVRVFVQAKKLNTVRVTGSGDLNVKGTITGENLEAAVTGSGSMNARVNVTNLSASVTGSGEAEISGLAKNARVIVTGSGDFEGDDLSTMTSSAKVSGSGNISLGVEKELDAAVSGSGNISYAGNPSVKSSKSGSGRISRN